MTGSLSHGDLVTFGGKPDLQSLSHGKLFIAELFSGAVLVKHQNPITSVNVVLSCWSSLRENLEMKARVTSCSVPLAKENIAEGTPVMNHTMHNSCSWLGSACQARLLLLPPVLGRCAGHCCSIQALGRGCFEHSLCCEDLSVCVGFLM